MENVDKQNLPSELKIELEKIENGKIDDELSVIPKNQNDEILEIPKTKEYGEKEILDFSSEEEEGEDLTLVLKKPIKGIVSIQLNPDKISGATLTHIEKSWRSKNKTNREQIKELDGDYLAMVAAIMSGIKYTDILELGGFDFNQLILKVRSFLLVG